MWKRKPQRSPKWGDISQNCFVLPRVKKLFVRWMAHLFTIAKWSPCCLNFPYLKKWFGGKKYFNIIEWMQKLIILRSLSNRFIKMIQCYWGNVWLKMSRHKETIYVYRKKNHFIPKTQCFSLRFRNLSISPRIFNGCTSLSVACLCMWSNANTCFHTLVGFSSQI